MKRIQFTKSNGSHWKKLFCCMLVILVLCSLIGYMCYYSKKRIENTQNQIQSIECVRVYAGKTRLNTVWTNNISEIWFSEEVTDGRVDVSEACARYGMTEAEIRAFSEHYADYAVVDIPLRIDNFSDLIIGGFRLSFKIKNINQSIWLYNGYPNGLYSSFEPGSTGHCTMQALVNLSACPIDQVDAAIKDIGLKVHFDYTPQNGNMDLRTIDVLFDCT